MSMAVSPNHQTVTSSFGNDSPQGRTSHFANGQIAAHVFRQESSSSMERDEGIAEAAVKETGNPAISLFERLSSTVKKKKIQTGSATFGKQSFKPQPALTPDAVFHVRSH